MTFWQWLTTYIPPDNVTVCWTRFAFGFHFERGFCSDSDMVLDPNELEVYFGPVKFFWFNDLFLPELQSSNFERPF